MCLNISIVLLIVCNNQLIDHFKSSVPQKNKSKKKKIWVSVTKRLSLTTSKIQSDKLKMDT